MHWSVICNINGSSIPYNREVFSCRKLVPKPLVYGRKGPISWKWWGIFLRHSTVYSAVLWLPSTVDTMMWGRTCSRRTKQTTHMRKSISSGDIIPKIIWEAQRIWNINSCSVVQAVARCVGSCVVPLATRNSGISLKIRSENPNFLCN